MSRKRKKPVPILTEEEFRGEARGQKGNCPEGSRFRFVATTVSDEGDILSPGTEGTRCYGIKQRTGAGLLVPVKVEEDKLYFIAASTLVEVIKRS